MIDFHTDETHVLLNPRLDVETRRRLESKAEMAGLAAHVWIATSGTTGSARLVALSKTALLASAAAVNRRLEVTGRDVWACALPTFHVGGLGIHARAMLADVPVVETVWQPLAFAAVLDERRVTLASLVPAQVVDLIERGVTAPKTLRAVIVGGGALRKEDREAALRLGWPVLPSYGMTETASQIATARSVKTAELELLDHAECEVDPAGRLMVRGPSLLSGWIADEPESRFVDPKTDGWFIAEDRVEVSGRIIRVLGRGDDFIKIGGESVDLTRLDEILGSISRRSILVDVSDRRLGAVLHLLTEEAAPALIAEAFNARVLPFERIRGVHPTAQLPRTELGKVSRSEARKEVQKNLESLE